MRKFCILFLLNLVQIARTIEKANNQTSTSAEISTSSGSLLITIKDEHANNVTIVQGEKEPLLILCQSQQKEIGKIKWRKDKKDVSSDMSSDVYQQANISNKVILIVKNAAFSDSGIYTCIPPDKINMRYATINITVTGGPIISDALQYIAPIENNRVVFTCIFYGYPLPSIDWYFSNGNPLPISSQFKKGHEISDKYRTERNLTVYGVNCKQASLMSYICVATSAFHGNIPVNSSSFIANISLKYLSDPSANYSTCANAVKTCQSKRGGNLLVVPSLDIMNNLNRYSGNVFLSYYWISSQTIDYFTKWHTNSKEYQRKPANEGCIRVKQATDTWSRVQTTPSKFMCEIRYVTQPTIHIKIDECDGRNINITWDMLPGDSSIDYQVLVFGAENIIENVSHEIRYLFLNTLKPRFAYTVQVRPLYIGCENAALMEKKYITTGRGNLTLGFVNVYYNKSSRTCTVTWRRIGAFSSDIRKYEAQIITKVNNYRKSSSFLQPVNSSDQISGSLNTYDIQIGPNSEYNISIIAYPSSPCTENVSSNKIVAKGCTSPIAPRKVPTPLITSSTSSNNASVTLEPVDERNGLISCIFLVIQKGNIGSTDTIETDLDKLRTSNTHHIALAVPRFSTSRTISLGDGNSQICNIYDLGSTAHFSCNWKSHQPSQVLGNNQPLEPGALYTCYVLVAIPANDGNVLYSASARSEEFWSSQVSFDVKLSQTFLSIFPLTTTAINCTSIGTPPPDVIWQKDQKTIQSSSQFSVHQTTQSVNFSSKRATLFIANPKLEDGGTYTCISQSKPFLQKKLTLHVQGAPNISSLTKYASHIMDNKVNFTCVVDGFPLPQINWLFSNLNHIPTSSQFQVLDHNQLSFYRVSRSLIVYGVLCKETSLLGFRCSASNNISSGPVLSENFYPEIPRKFLKHFGPGSLHVCNRSRERCQKFNGLPVVPNVAVLKQISSVARKGNLMSYWISIKSSLFGKPTSYEGCLKINVISNKLVSSASNTKAQTLCEDIRPAEQSNISLQTYECDGTQINVSWEIRDDASSIPHRILLNGRVRNTTSPGIKTFLLDSLIPHKVYNVQVFPLFIGCQNAPILMSNGKNITTGRGSVSQPQSLTMTYRSTKKICEIKWKQRFGKTSEIGFYNISISESINQSRSGSSSLGITTYYERSESTSYQINNLKPNTNYKVAVGAYPDTKCSGKILPIWSPPIGGECVTPPGAPNEVKLSPIPPVPGKDGVKVTLAPISERNGLISCVFVIVRKVDAGINSVSNETDPSKLAQSESDVANGIPFVAQALTKFSSQIEVILGDGSSSCCDTSNTGEQSDCTTSSKRKRRAASNIVEAKNRHLLQESNYTYYVLTATPSGSQTVYTASNQSSPFTSIAANPIPSNNGPGLTIAIIVIVVLIIVAIILFVLYRKRILRVNKPLVEGNSHPMTDITQPVTMEMKGLNVSDREESFDSSGDPHDNDEDSTSFFNIIADSLISTYESKRRDSDKIFEEEFKVKLPTLVSSHHIDTTSAKLPENVTKNRYKNILPSEDYRVVLRTQPGQEHSDYINASYIDGYNQPNKFIAAQGPKEKTVYDFWQMVIQNNCCVIAMVTQIKEGYKEKSAKYWPDVGEYATYGDVNVYSNSQMIFGEFCCTVLTVTDSTNDTNMEVLHFQYLNWPDHGIPSTTSTLLRFYKAVREAHRDESGPILVHCSAGVGRTGTLLALDILKDQLIAEEKVNVFETVYKMRLRRSDMVQTLAQYVYIHKLLAEIYFFGDTDVDVSDFLAYETFLLERDEVTLRTGMDAQFELLDAVPPSFVVSASAKKRRNTSLNNDSSVLPYDNNLAFIGMTMNDKDVPYVNASNIQTYNSEYHVIIAQDPIPSNINFFWRCVIDNDIGCVLMLGGGESTPKYWADCNTQVTFNDVTVETTNETECVGFVERSIKLFKDNKVAHDVDQIVINEWPQDGVPSISSSSLLEVASIIQKQSARKTKNVRGKKFLALIHCNDGSSQAGTFCAILNLLERLKTENKVDVFRAVKDVRDMRCKAISNVKQFELCYQVIRDFIQSFDMYGNFK